jgi:hypothetical protein
MQIAHARRLASRGDYPRHRRGPAHRTTPALRQQMHIRHRQHGRTAREIHCQRGRDIDRLAGLLARHLAAKVRIGEVLQRSRVTAPQQQHRCASLIRQRWIFHLPQHNIQPGSPARITPMAIERKRRYALHHSDRLGRWQRNYGCVLRPREQRHETQPVGHRMTLGECIQPIGATRKHGSGIGQDDRHRLADRFAGRIADAPTNYASHPPPRDATLTNAMRPIEAGLGGQASPACAEPYIRT